MHAGRIKTLLITLTFCVSVILCGCQGEPEIQEFSFVIASDIHVPSYSFPVGDPLDEESLMQMHNQHRLQEFVEECLTMIPRPSFIMNTGDTGDAGWLPLLKLYRKVMQPLVFRGDFRIHRLSGTTILIMRGSAGRTFPKCSIHWDRK